MLKLRFFWYFVTFLEKNSFYKFFFVFLQPVNQTIKTKYYTYYNGTVTRKIQELSGAAEIYGGRGLSVFPRNNK